MKIVFAGTPNISIATVKELHQSQHEVVAVYTQPDRPKGRGRKVVMGPVSQWAHDNHIPLENHSV